MAITRRLIKTVTHGDYSRIAELYNRHHKKDGVTTDASYVRKVVNGDVSTTSGTIAFGILCVAKNYLSMKEELNRKLVLN
jgi:hypothetical protein